ncbi:MAG TPA: PspC domain-containing protein [Chloroflexia bacterium]
MNGTSRLYRSTSQRMLGGVAAGLASYLGIDPNAVRLIFLVLAFVTGGGFALVYMLLWLLIPGTASTAADVHQIVNENVNDIGAQLRSLTGTKAGTGGNGGVAQPNGGANVAQGQLPPAGATTQHRHGNPAVALIAIGVFFLLLNLGFFRFFAWGVWWPLLLVGLGVMMISRRA